MSSPNIVKVGTWAVCFLNEDTGKVCVDTFYANGNNDAMSCFRACYRHGLYRILGVMFVRGPQEDGGQHA